MNLPSLRPQLAAKGLFFPAFSAAGISSNYQTRVRSRQCTPHAPREDGAATDNGSLRFGRQRKFLTRSVRSTLSTPHEKNDLMPCTPLHLITPHHHRVRGGATEKRS